MACDNPALKKASIFVFSNVCSDCRILLFGFQILRIIIFGVHQGIIYRDEHFFGIIRKVEFNRSVLVEIEVGSKSEHCPFEIDFGILQTVLRIYPVQF